MKGGRGYFSGERDCKAGRAVEVHWVSKGGLVPNHFWSRGGVGAEAGRGRSENQRVRRRV